MKNNFSKSDISSFFNFLIKEKDYDGMLNFFFSFYNEIVKKNEAYEHYQKCYEFIEPFAEYYGNYLKNMLPDYSGNIYSKTNTKICYFFPNIGNDLTHIELFFSTFKEHDAKSNLKIYVASFSPLNYKSKFIKELELSKKILVIPIEKTSNGLLTFLNNFTSRNFGQLIIVSAPILIQVLVEVLGEKKVSWLSMKFELSCFKKLKNRISYQSSKGEISKSDTVTWYRNLPALINYNIKYEGPVRRIPIKFVTINREEKINDLDYLSCVAQILLNVKDSTFSWTGRTENTFISAFFKEKGLEKRVHYIGWVEPYDMVNNFDIFLDVPNLSGYVSAQYFAMGFPIVNFKNSNSWVEFFEKEFRSNPSFKSEEFIANSNLEYIDLATELAKNFNLRQFKSNLQKELGLSFFSTKKMYESHMEIIRKIIQEN